MNIQLIKTVAYRTLLRPDRRNGLIIILLAGLSACGQGSDGSAELASYHHVASGIVVEQASQYQVERQFAGLVVPRQSTDIGFERGGEAAEMRVDEGSRVERGQLLAALDQRLLNAEREQLLAQQRDLAAQLELNKANRVRQRDLKSRGFAADQRIDELAAEQDSLRANQARLDGALAGNQVQLDQSRLVAPFAGTISRRFVDEGTIVGNGQAVFRLLESASMEVRVGVPARLVSSLKVGDTASIWAAQHRWAGSILAVGSDISRATLTVPVRISLPEQSTAVAGDQAYLNLAEVVAGDGFWVPMTALTDGIRGLWNVYVLQPLPGQSVHAIEARDVQIAFTDNERAFVSGALADGEVIVAAGLQRLVPGQQVRLAEGQLESTAFGQNLLGADDE